MSTAKFEQLIDLIINEDQERAEQLFHEIVVEKSREIYESLMDEEMSGDMPEELMREVSAEETNMAMAEADDEEGMDDLSDLDDEGEEMPGEEMPGEEMPGDDMGDMEDMEDMGSEEPATKDDIMNLEDKLDQILAQFEEEQGEESEEPSDDMSADMGDMGGMDSEEAPVMEAHELKAVGGKTYDKFGKMGDNGANTKSPVANKGQMGMAGNPVKFSGASETMPSSPKANTGYVKQGADLINKPKNAIDGAGNLGSGKGESTPKPKNEDPGKSKSPVVAESKKIVKKFVR